MPGRDTSLASFAGAGGGTCVLGLRVLKNRVGDVRDTTVDALQVREQIEVDCAGLV